MDLGFSDGTYLMRLECCGPKWKYRLANGAGTFQDPDDPKQWNKISTYIASGEDTIGKTITKVLVGYHKPSNPTGADDAFTADIDDIRIEEVPQVEQEHLSDYVYTLRGHQRGTSYSAACLPRHHEASTALISGPPLLAPATIRCTTIS